jgi:hypothetical protein
MNPEPLYTHDCNKCIYLGQHRDGVAMVDLYVCPSTSHLPTTIARYSSEPEDYASGISFALSNERPNPLSEALYRAFRRDLLAIKVREEANNVQP